MRRNQGLIQLQAILSEQYGDESASKQVVLEAGLPDGEIKYTSARLLNWQSILEQADNYNKVEDIVIIAKNKFPHLEGKLEESFELYTIQSEEPEKIEPETPHPLDEHTPAGGAQPEPLRTWEVVLINIVLFVGISIFLLLSGERFQISAIIPLLEFVLGLALLVFSTIHVFIHYVRPRSGDEPGEMDVLGISGRALSRLFDAIHPQTITSLILWLSVIVVMVIVGVGWLMEDWPIEVAVVTTSTYTPTPDLPSPTRTLTPVPDPTTPVATPIPEGSIMVSPTPTTQTPTPKIEDTITPTYTDTITTPTLTPRLKVVTHSVTLRSGPSDAFEDKGYLNENDVVPVIARTGKNIYWYSVETDDDQSTWVYGGVDAIEIIDADPTMIPTADPTMIPTANPTSIPNLPTHTPTSTPTPRSGGGGGGNGGDPPAVPTLKH